MSCSKAQIESVEDFQWKNRLLIIVSGEDHQSTLKNQLTEIQEAEHDYVERDLKIIILKNNTVTIWKSPASHQLEFDDITDQLNISKNEGYINLLIGKDGGVKLRENSPISNQTLFNTIDAMPMRQREMRDGN
jgi:hypothetical protein